MPIRITDTFRVSGVETDPTTVVYSILGPDGELTTYSWPGAPEITHVGVGVFRLNLSPPALPGYYTYDVDSTGTVVASRSGAFVVLPNVTSPADVSWATSGPCLPWASSQSVWECCSQPMVTVDGDECPVDFTAEVMAASQILFELSGRRFNGSCEKTVRPCGRGWCGGPQILSRGYVVWSGFYWQYYLDGERSCGCQPMDRVLLSGYPVREILEVKIDGVAIDPSEYRLDERRYLTRMRDSSDPGTMQFWPACQIMDLPDTEEGTFSVTYRYGMDPPLAGTLAATALACQLYRACGGGGDCELPTNVTRVSRQGVVIDKQATINWAFATQSENYWNTGMKAVDDFLNAYNPQRLTRRPSSWSPDGKRYARRVGT